MTKIMIFVVGASLLAAISWRALLRPCSHGFYRFFAWEIILGNAVLNGEFWFVQPFAWHQLLAWFLLILSLVFVVLGVGWLNRKGKQNVQRDQKDLYAFEKTTRLVTEGVYAYIRHPMYSSLLFLAWGIFFKRPDIVPGVLSVLATSFLLLTARAEEVENERYFGAEYLSYMQRTKRFVPFLF